MTSLVDQVVAVHRSLDRAEIPHAFGGAIALAFCIQHARATSDIDVNVFVAPSEAARVLDALPEGVVVTPNNQRAAKRDGQVRVQWDRTPVDLFFSYHELHDLAAARCRSVPFGDTTIPVLGCTDLAVFKAFFARTQDWADIENMARADTVDTTEALRRIGSLVGTDADRYERLTTALHEPPPEVPPPRLPG